MVTLCGNRFNTKPNGGSTSMLATCELVSRVSLVFPFFQHKNMVFGRSESGGIPVWFHKTYLFDLLLVGERDAPSHFQVDPQPRSSACFSSSKVTPSAPKKEWKMKRSVSSISLARPNHSCWTRMPWKTNAGWLCLERKSCVQQRRLTKAVVRASLLRCVLRRKQGKQ